MYQQLAEFEGEGGPAWLVKFDGFDSELRYLRSLITKFRAMPEIRNLAVEIIKNAGVFPKDKRGQALAIARYVQRHVYYVHELPERFQWPTETLRLKAGDCDDFTTLIGALAESLGIPIVMVVMQLNGRWAHIFPAAQLPSGLLALDATLSAPVGEESPISLAKAAGKRVLLKMA